MFRPGQDVVVNFDGEDYEGEVLEHIHGWVMARVLIDPSMDHGGMTPMLGVRSIVNVRDTDVRLAGDDRPEQDQQEVL